MMPPEIKNSMYGFMMSHVLFVGDETGVFDYLAQGGFYTTKDLAEVTDLKSSALERLLLGGVAIGLVQKRANTYGMPEHLRPFLQKSSPEYCGEAFSHFREISTRIFPYLKEALKENRPQFQHIFGNLQDVSPFAELYNDSQRLDNFLASMWGMGYAPAKELVEKYPLDKYHTLVDIGGGSGSFSIAALEKVPTLNAVVFDLPKVRSFLDKKCLEYQLLERLKFVAGDFFKNELPQGDVYVLGYILSDWNREDGTNLLKKIFNSLPQGGAIFILEKLFDEDKNGPLETAMMNLAMLLETWGKHYSGSEYISWLEKVGFQNCRIIRTSGEKHMIVGIK
jgi:ubiquinone/menaquinone biosynthesis C-methylase UbiE